MIPSRTWFPSTLQDRDAWFQNFAVKMSTLGPTLGFSAAEVTSIENDATWMQFHGTVATAVDTYIDAIRAFRKNQTEGDIGSPALTWPADITFTPPGPIVAAPGIFARLDKYVKRIRASAGYTPEVGAQLGIVPTKGDELIEDEMKPVIKPNPMPGSIVDVKFTRGESDGVVLETKVDGAPGWTNQGKFLKSPVELIIPDGNGLPHSVQLRARYFIGNDPVGLYSEIYTVVTTP